MTTPLEKELHLQVRVRRAVEDNPDLAARTIAKRFGIGVVRLGYLINDDPPYPSTYKMAAKRLGQPIEVVTRHKEREDHWCTRCKAWAPLDQYTTAGAIARHHMARYCAKE
jgi:hypothetical protein